jgi:hypothetical protein
VCWELAIVELRKVAVTTPSFFCSPVSVFVLERWFLFSSKTLTGELVKSWFAEKGCVTIGCRYRTMWARP